MARKRKSPPTAKVVAILWWDADGKLRSQLDTRPVMQYTVGFNVFEDDKQVVLAHEISSTEDWMQESMDYTKIPKPLIQKRTELGELTIEEEESAGEEMATR